MRLRLVFVLALGALGGVALAAACSPFAGNDDNVPADTTDETEDAGTYIDPGGLNTTGIGAGTGADTGLPCDVQQLLENRCIGCHLGTSQIPLLAYDDLVEPSKSDPTKNMAAMALARMQNTTSPMPPPPAVAPNADEVAVFADWVGKNEPRATAGCTPPTVADAGVDAAIYNTPLKCTSNKYWVAEIKNDDKKGGIGPRFGGGGFGGGGGFPTGGGAELSNASSTMEPGKACITCHSILGGPSYALAGTVYPTAHEPDDCNGVNGGVDIVITDVNGKESKITANAVGNFFQSGKIAAPFHVKIRQGEKERAMATALTAGDCNTCHTANGANGAPGRIMAP